MERYLLCLDMDGTILNDRGELGEESLAAIKRIRMQGHVVSFVTGRREIDMVSCRHFYRCADYMLLGNGAKLLDLNKREMLFSAMADKEGAMRLIEHCLAEDLQLYVMMGEKYAVTKITPGVQEYIDQICLQPAVFSRIDEIPLEKVEGFMSGSDREAIAAFITAEGLPFSCVPSDPVSCDVIPIGVSKWSGVQRLAELLYIPQSRILAVGNYDNDIEMLRHAGIGVAVANATETVRKSADYVTKRSNNQDALVEIASIILCM